MSKNPDSLTNVVTTGGVAAKHPPAVVHDVLVGPSTNGEFNTVELDFAPEACVRFDDVRFEFDSSFIGPEAATELKLLGKLIKEGPERPASIFGHADPVGDDDYNKILSGRRSQAMYGLLTRKTELWEDLFKNPQGGDSWGTESIQVMLKTLGHYSGPINGTLDTPTRDAVKAFQGSPEGAGLVVDGDPGQSTRPKLYKAYMDRICVDDADQPFQLDPVKNFLAQGADAGGKGDFQGCSEFNPDLVFSQAETNKFKNAANKAERDQENKPNRRVVVYLFRKGSKISPASWPCPRAKEGVAACRKRFFSDGEKRRTPTATRRLFKDTKDTFACRFYDRISTLSPCESPPPPPPPVVATLEFVLDTDNNLLANASDAVTTFARMGLWDRAFDAAGAVLNNEAEADNFVGADSRRFYLRVRDTAVSGSVQVNWRTLDAAGNNLDAPATQSITLLETGAGAGVFTSKALMLVTDTNDQNQATHSGLPAGNPDAGVRNRGQSNHRIRRGSMFGSVEAEYTPAGRAAASARITVFQRSADERRRVPIQIFVLRVAA
ncbi:MAG: peptidoglycan-binding protein, partial [Acidobacteriota bacterium]|nr:peptidoglycan-binding protein [Acidobacteriota bacterium]